MHLLRSLQKAVCLSKLPPTTGQTVKSEEPSELSEYRSCNNPNNRLPRVLTLLRLIEFSIKFDTFRAEWSIVCIEGSQTIISREGCISSSEDRCCASKQCRQ